MCLYANKDTKFINHVLVSLQEMLYNRANSAAVAAQDRSSKLYEQKGGI